MNIQSSNIVQRVWNYCNVLRDDGISYSDYVEQLNITEDEIAFYDALEVNDSAVMLLGDDTLKSIARELVKTVRNNATIDWTLRETVRAKLRVMVKRILRKYSYPPDKQKKATVTVLQQAELIAKDWAG